MTAPQTIEVSERTLGWLLDRAGLAERERKALKGLVRECALSGRPVGLGGIRRMAGWIQPLPPPPPGFAEPAPPPPAPPPPPPTAPAPAPPPPGAGPAPAPPPYTGPILPPQRPLDLTYTRPQEADCWGQGPFGMMRVPCAAAAPPPAAAPAVAPEPEPVAGPRTAELSPSETSRMLDLVERSLEAACVLAQRARRCGATASDADAAAAIAACMDGLMAAAGPVTEIAAKLCAARTAGTGAVLTEGQIAALTGFEQCLGAAGAALPAGGPSLLQALVSLAIPAAGALAVAL